MGRILAIRGGAIGDFVLTLPAITLLRNAYPENHVEILGYRHIVALADDSLLAAATRSIEAAPMAGFFARNGPLDPGLCDYFASFNLVVSWLYDPDQLFQDNLRRAGVRQIVSGDPRVGDHEHAAFHFARPLEKIAIYLDNPAPNIRVTEQERLRAAQLLGPGGEGKSGVLLLHPGSGSPKKNWPTASWLEFVRALLETTQFHPALVFGEAEGECFGIFLKTFDEEIRRGEASLIQNASLREIAALAAHAGRYVGHDTGISHIAAAAGARCLLLFGPTDPLIWAPRNPGVQILQPAGGDLTKVSLEEVLGRVLNDPNFA